MVIIGKPDGLLAHILPHHIDNLTHCFGPACKPMLVLLRLNAFDRKRSLDETRLASNAYHKHPDNLHLSTHRLLHWSKRRYLK
mmetsp:Transcript_846/g.1684  ORF Transcript_846/g.1684 Transcript_846/m.1684 type:complete len:83 (+) Transcript_846:188-436(+)